MTWHQDDAHKAHNGPISSLSLELSRIAAIVFLLTVRLHFGIKKIINPLTWLAVARDVTQ